MAINFPNNPSVNDTFTVGGTKFTFTGVKWETGAVVEVSSDITPTLGGDLDAATHNINNVGIITATTFSGNADTATNAQGLTGNPSIQVTNATVLGNLDVQGTTTTIDTAITEVDSLNVEGSVGIGTTNPRTDLQVGAFGGGDSNIQLATGTSGASNILFGDGNAGSDYYKGFIKYNHSTDNLELYATDDIIHYTGGSETLRIDSSGNVNIGVNDSSNPFSHLRFGASQYGAADIRPTDDGSHKVGLAFYVDGTQDTTINPTEALRVTSDGRIGVATDNPNSMGRVSIVVPSTGGHGAINIQNPEVGTGKTNIVFRSLDNNGGNWADAELRAEGYSFKIRTTERFRIDFDGTVSDSMGPLRDVPLNDQSSNASYTLIASDAGKVVHAHSTTTTVVVPNSVFSVGNVVTILNGGTGNIAINQGSGLSLRNNGDGSTGNRTLAQFGMATIYFTGASVCYISGSNMT